jgi:hypothetical protein
MPFQPNERIARTGLRDQLADLAEMHGYYAAWMADTENARVQTHLKTPCQPLIEQRLFADACVHALNKHEWLDGQWIVAYTHPAAEDLIPREMTLLWKDQDGDVPFVVTFERDMMVREGVGVDHVVENARKAYQEWRQHEDDLGITPEQKRKRAQGEPSQDPTQAPEVPT